MRDLKKVDLIIPDDFGMVNPDPATSRDLPEVIDDRFGTRGTIIVSQLPVMKWHELFEDGTIADAAPDRLVHNSCRFETKGDTGRRE